ncbi:phenoloxidase-activating factor 2-like [Sitodiplosis mosellana]|uniref:phenoloxidase-activating factor 2-like n=1 Tax=Sitodiplosis mosellana TaxID=263140 RepID=UPI0024438B4E|nr:phenoloxidase-activating factor 2-like [Sitodiplosis mosellana]
MPHYLCINDMVVTNGTELFEWRISEKLVCGNLEMPCCADDAMKYLHSASNEDQSEEIDSSEDHEDENEVTDEGTALNEGKCGYRKQQNTATRIIDGDEAQPNEYPWVVGIFFRLSSGNLRYIGGGSLIHESVIMTAAHFLLQLTPEQLVIRAGEHDILDTTVDKKRQERNVTNIILHENLDANSLINDIALIVLEKSFKLTEAVNTVCLPPQSVQTDKNVMCTTGGWGKNAADRHGKYQAKLKKVDLPIVERGKCENLLRKTRLGPYYNLDNSLMCAGGGKRDTCKGDGGSPLFCKIPHDSERFYQTGIVAGGIGCGRKVPGMYVNVAHFTNWISQQLGFINLHLKPQNVLQYELFD